jgi:hypothetical protein
MKDKGETMKNKIIDKIEIDIAAAKITLAHYRDLYDRAENSPVQTEFAQKISELQLRLDHLESELKRMEGMR